MSVSAASQPAYSGGYSDPNQLVPVLPSENATTAAALNKDAKHLPLFQEGDDSPSFWDVLDVINPLQHIPVVNSLYQDLTGDTIGVGARLTGGALFGGAIGLLASAIGCIVEEETGDSVGGHILALFEGDDQAATQVAEAKAEPAAAAVAAASPPAEAAGPAAPVITLPEAAPAAAAAPAAPMVFTVDGLVQASPSPTPVAPATAAKPASPAADQAAAGPASGRRFMPVPARTTHSAENAPPVVTVPVSNNSARSRVPITGRTAASGNQVNAGTTLAVQKAMAEQGLPAGVQHPMLAPDGQVAPGDWLQAMNGALDKYQKAGSLAERAQAPTSLELQ